MHLSPSTHAHNVQSLWHIAPTDKQLTAALQDKIDNLNKPKGSLGRLEELALQLGLIQQTLTPRLQHPCHLLFAGDHGIEREGVSLSPREITWQQMLNYCKGGGGVNMFCRQHGFTLQLVDVGVDYTFEGEAAQRILDRKIARGTRNFRYEAAMTRAEMERALCIGAECVDACCAEGSNLLCFGEMGIANTSPSSVLMHLLLGIPLEQCVGAGAGLNSEGVRHKLAVLQESVARSGFLPLGHKTNDMGGTSPISPAQETLHEERCPLPRAEVEEVLALIRYFCGYEMVAAIGGMLRAAQRGCIVLVDGFIMSACMLAASHLAPAVMDYAVFGHCGDEGGHRRMLEGMHARPLLHLGLRLGEGTGALCAYPLLQSAVNMINEMDNFQHAAITKYF